MFDDNYQIFENIPEDALDGVGEQMQEIIDKITELPAHMKDEIIKNMYGNMKIHDNIMEIWDTEGVLIRTFDLRDIANEPTTTSPVFERIIKD